MNRSAVIPLSALVVAGTITFAEMQKKGTIPDTKQWLGLSVTYMGISLASDLGFAPAGGFAALIMVTAFVTRGYEAVEYLTVQTGQPKQKQKKRRKVRVKQPDFPIQPIGGEE